MGQAGAPGQMQGQQITPQQIAMLQQMLRGQQPGAAPQQATAPAMPTATGRVG
jgi:hypothetical protein